MSSASEQHTENSQNPIADELRQVSEAEASEQKPLEEDPVARLENELNTLKDNHLRLYAEFENYKRRNLKERSELIRNAGSEILQSLLPVLDDFERALKALGNDTSNPLTEGVQLIHQKMNGILEQRGLKAMNAIGQPFDVELHEAITEMPVQDDAQKGKVIDEVERGYMLHDKVLRYAKVVIGR